MIIIGLLLFVFLLLVACGIGIRLSQWLRVSYSSRLECCAFAIGLGLVVYIGAGFVLGALGWLNKWGVLLSLGALILIGLPARGKINQVCARTALPQVESGVRYLAWIAATFLLLLGLVNLLGALAPDTIWDAHLYHLNVPKQWLSAGRMVYIPYNLYSDWPLNLSVIYAIEMALIDGSTLPQLTHFSLGVLSTLLIYAFVRSRYGSLGACFASVIFYSIPVMTWLSGTAICDLGVAYFTLFAVIAFLWWTERDEPGWLKMAAVGTGLAMRTKLTGLFTLALLILSIFYYGLSKREPFRRMARQAALVSVIAVGLALPWYLKSYLQTGNPIFPFGYNLFGGKYWTPALNARNLAGQFGYMGIGRSLQDYVLLPLRLLVPSPFPYEGPVSWVFFGALLWSLARRKDKTVTYLSIYAVVNFVFWAFFTTQQVRMLLPALGLWAIVAGMGVTSATAHSKFREPALLLVMFALIIEGTWDVWRERSGVLNDQLSFILGGMSRDDYLQKHFELADVFSFMNTQLPPEGAVLAYNEVRGYLSQREFIFGTPSLQAYVDYDQLKTRNDLRHRLDELGVTYVLINDTTGKAPLAVALRSIRDDLQLIYKKGTVYLYRLIPVEQAGNRDCYVAWDSAYECRANIIPQIPVGEVTAGARVAQLFTSQCAGLNRIGLYMATYARDNTSFVGFRLAETASQERVWEYTLPAADIPDDEWRDFDFAPLKDSEGKQYRLTVLSHDGKPGNAITVWRSQTDVFPNGEALIDQQPVNADLIFRYGCSK